MKTSNLRLTPETIDQTTYCIPLYQRLFEWDEERIIQLLDDLKSQPAGKAYYIGMLTSTSNNDLVDGQQRFTVMMLMGIVLSKYYSDWKQFIVFNKKPRLSFAARPDDQEYLDFLIVSDHEESAPYENKKMKKGIECIRAYLETQFETDQERSEYAEYIYKHMTFFVTYLPENYRHSTLNKYFERMNSTGRNLEGHEIVKVQLLQKLTDEKDFYTQIWNRVSDMDKTSFRVRRGKDENETRLKERICKAISVRYSPHLLFQENLLNGLNGTEEQDGSGDSIKNIKESSLPPSKIQKNRDGSRSIMNFSDFLLQTLYVFLSSRENRIENITAFFNKANLVDTFKKYLLSVGTGEEIKEFFNKLLCYRVLLDVYFIRILDAQGDYDYDLETPFTEREESIKKLKMFESMIYVNSSPITYYQWFKPLMDIVDTENPVSPENLYLALKTEDDKMHPIESLRYENLSYRAGVDRYWFWRLDFQIWLKRKELFVVDDDSTTHSNDIRKAIDVAEKYVFKRNRSIEHIAPQTPQQEDTLILKEQDRDSFGNLVMISSEQNSSLSNSIFQEKRARVESFLDSSRSGSIESLKMLHAFTFYNTWNLDAINEHGRAMFELLLQSY